MRIGLTGATGFVGSALSQRLLEDGDEVVLVSRGKTDLPPELEDSRATFVRADVRDADRLREAFEGCDSVAHLAGINRERGNQTYEGVHVEGTRAVVSAATDAGVSRLALTSYLRARPNCGSGYLESKWRAEELVRNAGRSDADASGIEHTILKPGVVYGRGDQLLTHVARSLATLALFPRVGLRERPIRPLAVQDLVDALIASLTGERLANATVALLGPEELALSAMVRRIGEVMGRDPIIVPFPVHAQYFGAWLQERTMETPIVSRAAVRMLAEGVTEPAPPGVCDRLPDDLEPTRPFTRERVEAELPDVDRFGLADLRS